MSERAIVAKVNKYVVLALQVNKHIAQLYDIINTTDDDALVFIIRKWFFIAQMGLATQK